MDCSEGSTIAKATKAIITSKAWQETYKVPNVIKQGEKIPDALVSLIENNSPNLIDTFERASNGSYYRKKNYTEIDVPVKEVKEPKKEEKPKKKK